jgi:CRP-like cAMP-binding protein
VGSHPYRADACAATETAQVVGVRAEVVLSTLGNPALCSGVQRALLEQTEVLQSKIAIMSAGSVPQRLATLFSDLARKFGDEGGDGSTIVPVALSRSELAHLVGATVETTIRIVSAWQKAGLLTTTAKGFVLRGALDPGASPMPASADANHRRQGEIAP